MRWRVHEDGRGLIFHGHAGNVRCERVMAGVVCTALSSRTTFELQAGFPARRIRFTFILPGERVAEGDAREVGSLNCTSEVSMICTDGALHGFALSAHRAETW